MMPTVAILLLIVIRFVSDSLLSLSTQDSKDGATEEEEKQAENGKKEEERGREPEGEREADKTESEMGTKGHLIMANTGNIVLVKGEKCFFFSC